ncbi:MAG: hypothetical protein WDN27_04455 [Candidatus Saccharibacteria bacterium]
MDVYAQIAASIIRHQEAIIGPVAVEQAEHIPHLKVNWSEKEVVIEGDPVPVIDSLVGAYSQLFGKISVEVSREASATLLRKLHPKRLPHSLE